MAIGGITARLCALSTTACLTYGVYQFVTWWLTPNPAEQLATQAIAAVDNYEDTEVDPKHPGVVVDAVVHVKCKLGTPRDTKANRMIVAAMVREYYDTKADMRRCDKLKFGPLAIELCFVPTAAEVLARMVRETKAVAERKAAAPAAQQ